MNWDSFKWRNHQPDIGRFFNIDPLAESFYYNSPYAFSENKVTNHIELEGLESYPAQQALNREIKKVENVIMNVVDKVAQAVDKVINFTDGIPKEPVGTEKEPMNDIVVNIYDDQNHEAGPDNKYLPLAGPLAKPVNMEKSFLDGMTSIESLKRPTGGDVGQNAENLATGVEKASGAAQASNDSNVVLDTTYTTGNVAKGDGAIYNSRYVIKDKKDTINEAHYVSRPKKQ